MFMSSYFLAWTSLRKFLLLLFQDLSVEELCEHLELSSIGLTREAMSRRESVSLSLQTGVLFFYIFGFFLYIFGSFSF